jgi:hypothetical protein
MVDNVNERISSQMKLQFDYDPKTGDYRFSRDIYGIFNEDSGNINPKYIDRVGSLIVDFCLGLHVASIRTDSDDKKFIEELRSKYGLNISITE